MGRKRLATPSMEAPMSFGATTLSIQEPHVPQKYPKYMGPGNVPLILTADPDKVEG